MSDPTDSAIERGARALFEHWCERGPNQTWGRLTEAEQDKWRADAQAVLLASYPQRDEGERAEAELRRRGFNPL